MVADALFPVLLSNVIEIFTGPQSIQTLEFNFSSFSQIKFISLGMTLDIIPST